MPQVNNSEIPVNPNLNPVAEENRAIINIIERNFLDERVIMLDPFKKINEISIRLQGYLQRSAELIRPRGIIAGIKKSIGELIQPIICFKWRKNLNNNFMNLKNYNNLRGALKWRI